jgi:hypothetical protein
VTTAYLCGSTAPAPPGRGRERPDSPPFRTCLLPYACRIPLFLRWKLPGGHPETWAALEQHLGLDKALEHEERDAIAELARVVRALRTP